MKKRAFFSSLIISVIFFSCSAPKEEFSADIQSIRNLTSACEEKIEWTESVETLELPAVKGAEGILSGVKPSAQHLSTLKNPSEPVFPFIEGFAPLNTTGSPEDSIKPVTSLCESLAAGTAVDVPVKNDRTFLLTVFSYMLSKQTPEKSKISSYFIGSPFVCDEYVQFPVRLFFESTLTDYTKKPHVDFFVYLQKEGDVYKIYDFDFKKKSVENGDEETQQKEDSDGGKQ